MGEFWHHMFYVMSTFLGVSSHKNKCDMGMVKLHKGSILILDDPEIICAQST